MPQLALSLAESTQLPLQLSMVPVQEEELPPTAVLPPTVLLLPPVVLVVFPEPPLPLALFPEPPLVFPVSPLSGKAASGGDENDPHAAAMMAPSDTTADTGMRERIFFMATSPIGKAS
jgi:hypothetical protein